MRVIAELFVEFSISKEIEVVSEVGALAFHQCGLGWISLSTLYVGLIYFNVHFLAPSFLVSLKLFDIISLQTSELDLKDIKLFHENEIA